MNLKGSSTGLLFFVCKRQQILPWGPLGQVGNWWEFTWIPPFHWDWSHTMELKGRGFPSWVVLIKSKLKKVTLQSPVASKNHLKIGSFAKRSNASSLGRSLKACFQGRKSSLNSFRECSSVNLAGAWSREVDWGSDFEAAAFGDKRHILPDFHQVTKSVTSEFRNLLLHPSILVQHFLNDFFWYFPRNGTKHPSLVTFTVFSNEHFSTANVRRFMPWKNVQEKSSRRARSATDCCCGGVFCVAQDRKKTKFQKITTPFF